MSAVTTMRRRVVSGVLTVLACVLLSGCTGGAGGVASTTTQGTLVEAAPGLVILSDRGAIQGVVANEADLRIEGARVSLLGADLFQDTDATGGFLFRNVTTGTQIVVVQHEAYQSQEVRVSVEAGNVTQVSVHLLPREGRGAGYVPHTHDLWGGAQEVVLMDRDVPLASTPADATSAVAFANAQIRANSNQTWALGIVGDADDRAIVLPGTKEMRVTFTWNSGQITLPKLGFAYRTPTMTGNALTYLEPKANGGTWTIRVAAKDADSGHQKFSLWSLFAYAPNSYASPTSYTPAVAMGPLHVQVTLVRGEVELEPAHEDFWGDATELQLRDYKLVVFDGAANPTRNANYGLFLEQGRLVPPGTAQLRIEFRVAYTVQENINVLDWDLTWRTGAQNPQTVGLSQFARAAPKVNEPLHKVWELDLKPEETDAFYQSRSNWLFVPWPKPWPEEGMFLEPRARNLYLGVTAIKDPAHGSS